MKQSKHKVGDKGKRKVISYAERSSSSLSIARHYGLIKVNGDRYVLDYDNAPTKVKDGEVLYFPDLVLKNK